MRCANRGGTGESAPVALRKMQAIASAFCEARRYYLMVTEAETIVALAWNRTAFGDLGKFTKTCHGGESRCTPAGGHEDRKLPGGPQAAKHACQTLNALNADYA